MRGGCRCRKFSIHGIALSYSFSVDFVVIVHSILRESLFNNVSLDISLFEEKMTFFYKRCKQSRPISLTFVESEYEPTTER